MKLLIFGATGGIGRQVVAQALEQGHIITAFARTPAALDIQHPNFKRFQGDVMNLSSVEQAMQGQEAVVCVLGSGKKLTGTIRSEGTRQTGSDGLFANQPWGQAIVGAISTATGST